MKELILATTNQGKLKEIKAMLKDEEFLWGGIFTKEKQYAKKYDLTMEEIGNIQICLYYALHIKDECYNERINHLCD